MSYNGFYIASVILLSFHLFSSTPSATVSAKSDENCGCESLNEKLLTSRKVIQDLKKIIQLDPGGDPQNITSNWDGPDPCSYTGFICSPNPNYGFQLTISDVQFNGFNLKAPLANFLDKLTDISIFHINSNRFHGPIPSKIGASDLPFLFELDLSNNDFCGPFPVNLLQATNLTFLDLRYNQFSGAVPPEIFTLDVDVLFINNNMFTQQLPSDLGTSPALYQTFANNMFTGPIPESIYFANGTLLEILFLNNRLSGCLPWEIGLLKLARVFDVSRNQIHGPIPVSFACLEKMEILNLGGNLLNGSVPEEICDLPRLTNFTLRDNYFTEVGPKCRNLISNKVLDVSLNCISDLPDQKPVRECAWFLSRRPMCNCPDPYRYLPCKVLYGGSDRRRATEVGAVFSPAYGALTP